MFTLLVNRYERLTYFFIQRQDMKIKNGANIIRVHDVKEAVQASQVTDAIIKA